MWAGVNDDSWSGFAVFVPRIALVGVTWWLASPFTHPSCPAGAEDRASSWSAGSRVWPNGGTREPTHRSRTFRRISGRTARCRSQTSSTHLWQTNFAGYQLRIDGLVEKPAKLLICRAKGDAEAGTDHHAFLHSGMVRRREVGRRSDAPYPRPGEARQPMPVTRCSILRGRRRRRPLLRRAQLATCGTN